MDKTLIQFKGWLQKCSKATIYFMMMILTLTLVKSGFANIPDHLPEMQYEYPGKKLPIQSILGTWKLNDSTQIEFVKQHNLMVLEPKTHVNNYTFFISNDSVSAKGMAINWPPYDCILNLIDANTLEIKYLYFYSSDSVTLIYRRKE